VDLNLDKLKIEVLERLESAGFAVFQSVPHGLDGIPMVLWDAEREPDYQKFLDVATKSGVKIVLFATAAFEASDLEDLEEHLGELDLPRDEMREYKNRIRDLRAHLGKTCSLELGFSCEQRLYVYDVQPDWYDEFVELEEELLAQLGDFDDDGGDEDSLHGPYFSKN
jgi:hypothetical protein